MTHPDAIAPPTRPRPTPTMPADGHLVNAADAAAAARRGAARIRQQVTVALRAQANVTPRQLQRLLEW